MSDADDREDVPEVEVVCPDCHGGGEVVYRPCSNCDGTGHVPTELGRKILAMVSRYIGRVLRDATEG
jgi:DnaJ-class molecular chaperone